MMRDFFVSYHPDDQAWAEWLAWHLEKAGFTVAVRAWDFHPGSNAVVELNKAISESARTLLVLTPKYLGAQLVTVEWAATLAQDSTGEQRRVIPVRVEPCKPSGLLGPLVSIDLSGLDEAEGIKKLLAGVDRGRPKPETAPVFPRGPMFPGAAAHRAQAVTERRRPTIITGIGIATVLAIAVAVYYWNWARLSINDCAQVMDRWGMPECIGPLTAEASHRRIGFWRIYSQRGRVLRTEVRKGCGELMEAEEGISSWEYLYDAAGRVQSAVARNRRGLVVVQETLSDGLRRVERRDRHGNPKALKDSDASVVIQKYDDRGFVVSQKWLSAYGSPRRNTESVFGYRYKRNQSGLVIQSTALDINENPTISSNWCMGWKSAFNERGTLIERTCLGLDGKPAISKDGYTTEKIILDNYDFQVESRVFGKQGEPVLHKEGYAIRRLELDEYGNIARIRYLGIDEQPIIMKEGYATALYSTNFRGDDIGHQYFGVDGNPILNTDGYASLKGERNQYGEVLHSCFFDTKGKLTLRKNSGIACMHKEYDERGNLTQESYWGTDGKLALKKPSGAAILQQRYNDKDLLIEEVYLGLDNRPILSSSGVSIARFRYDDSGHEIEMKVFGIDSQPILGKDGFSILKKKYDERDFLIEGEFFDTNGQPTLIKNGFFRHVWEYDINGYLKKEAYYGIDNKLTLVPTNWVAGRDVVTNNQGLIEESRYFGIDGKPVLSSQGCAVSKSRFDANGNEIETACLDTANHLTLTENGWATLKNSYNERNQITRTLNLGIDGKPVLHKNGHAYAELAYDQRGNIIEAISLGKDGQSVLTKNGYAGIRYQYDQVGREAYRAFIGVDRRPLPISEGIAIIRSQVDARGNDISLSYFDEKDRPIMTKQGFSTKRMHYNERDRLIGEEFLDASGRLVLNSDGYATSRYRYDDRDNIVESSTFGLHGERIAHKDGHALLRREYDSHGNVVKESYYGLNEQPSNSGSYGDAVRKFHYNDHNLCDEVTLLGIDGKLAINQQEGWSIRRARYDERGNRIERLHFGTNGQPIVLKDGSTGFLEVFDLMNQMVRHIDFDIRRLPISGTAEGIKWRKDGEHFIITTSDGKPITAPDKLAQTQEQVRAHVRSLMVESLRLSQPALFNNSRGVLVIHVDSESLGQRIGLQPGDVILTYAAMPLNSPQALQAVIAQTRTNAEIVWLHDQTSHSAVAPPGKLGVLLEPQ